MLSHVVVHKIQSLASAALLAAPLTLLPLVADAQQEGGAYPMFADEIARLPEVHLARAEEYEGKAASYRKEAARQRKLLGDSITGNREPERANTDPMILEMRRHYEAYIEKVEAVALEAERFSTFHRKQWETLRGK
ncbi:MAG: hypothetical protein IPP07_25625 [Holophagales bacterium]|nr:hypothetical protein [Holophagales bacterium]